MKLRETFDVGVIGAGPKGLAVALAAQNQGARVVSFEAAEAGGNWQKGRMKDPRGILHENGWEVVPIPDLSFSYYWEYVAKGSDKTKYPLQSYGAPRVLHFRRYLRWLGAQLDIQQGAVHSIDTQRDGAHRITSVQNGLARVVDCRSIVVASGLIGYGGKEFVHDPTGLIGTSNRVAHVPTDVESRTQIVDFVGDAQDVAIIGSGIAGARPLWALQELPHLRQIHVVSTSDVVYPSGKVWAQDSQGNYVSALRRDDSDKITGDPRVQYHPTRVIGGVAFGDQVVLDTDMGMMPPVDAVLVATGYRYDANRIPFLGPLIAAEAIAVPDRHPLLEPTYQVSGPGNPSIYFLGEAAVTSIGPGERWLASTPVAASAIVDSIIINPPAS